ncbi:MAG: STAS domain-containing protein [Fibrobacteres bacterium]|nr:STAS domain-containing protein [Fibrobacterota bacterium]
MIQSVRKLGNYTVIDVTDPSRSYDDITSIRDTLETLLEQGEYSVAINLNKVDFVHSYFIKILTAGYKKLKVKGGDLCVIGANEFIRNLMRLLNIDEFITVFSNEESFKDYLQSK